MELPPAAGGNEVVSTQDTGRTRTNDTAGPPELIFNVFLAYDTWYGVFLGRT